MVWLLSRRNGYYRRRKTQSRRSALQQIPLSPPSSSRTRTLTTVETAENNLPIYACYLTLTSIRNDSEGFISQRQEAFGDYFSNPVTLPNQIVEDGDEIEFGEVNFRILEFPHNESLTMTMPYLPEQGVLFSGDLVGNQRTPVLREGLTAL
ncbi:MAG: hypothetical protein BRC54_14355 [Cyanobacteria bacterium SW_7_48_12]|nr:MAG: hypothetical protein BRC54_14355 [Cyanobacteria bacterium SW_7_48_12]